MGPFTTLIVFGNLKVPIGKNRIGKELCIGSHSSDPWKKDQLAPPDFPKTQIQSLAPNPPKSHTES